LPLLLTVGALSLVACIGGIVVFCGLWIEHSAEKKESPDLFTDIEKSRRLKANRGWVMLMVGIALEVVLTAALTGYTAWEEMNTNRQTAPGKFFVEWQEVSHRGVTLRLSAKNGRPPSEFSFRAQVDQGHILSIDSDQFVDDVSRTFANDHRTCEVHIPRLNTFHLTIHVEASECSVLTLSSSVFITNFVWQLRE